MQRFQKLERLEQSIDQGNEKTGRDDAARLLGLYAGMQASVLCEGKRERGSYSFVVTDRNGLMCVTVALSPEATERKDGEWKRNWTPISVLELVVTVNAQKNLSGILFCTGKKDCFIGKATLSLVPELMGDSLGIAAPKPYTTALVRDAENEWIPEKACVVLKSDCSISETAKDTISYVHRLMEGKGGFSLVGDQAVFICPEVIDAAMFAELVGITEDAVCDTLKNREKFLCYKMEGNRIGIKDESGIWCFGHAGEDPKVLREQLLAACEADLVPAVVINDLTQIPEQEEEV